jgi:ferrous iron transport protein A
MVSRTIASLKKGTKAKITRINHGAGCFRAKLLSMGLTPGARIHVKHVAPLGDPFQIETRGTLLSLRKQEARCIEVDLSS